MNRIKSLFLTIYYRIKYRNKLNTNGIINFGGNHQISIKDGTIKLKGAIYLEQGSLLAVSDSGILTVGEGVYINRNTMIVCRKKIEIGDGCSFGPNVCIYDHNHKIDSYGFYGDKFTYGNVKIGNKCWIGANVVILKNTSIGDNCVIGAGTIVSGDISPNSIVVSNRDNNVTVLRG